MDKPAINNLSQEAIYAFEIFGCFVYEKLKLLPKPAWRQAFASLTVNRNDVNEVRQFVMNKLKRDGLI